MDKLRTLVEKNEGLLFVIASEVFFTLMQTSAKLLEETGVSVLEILLIRMIITWTCSMLYMYYVGISNPILGPPGVRLLLCIRGFAGFFDIFGMYFSLKYLSLPDAIVLTFLGPPCTAVAGYLLLSEKFSVREAFAGIVSLLGVVLIARPPFLFGSEFQELNDIRLRPADHVNSAQRILAVAVALVGVVGVTAEHISIRAMGKRAHPLHNIMYLSASCAVASASSILAMRTPIFWPSHSSFIVLLLAVCTFGLFGQTLMVMGFQREDAGRASMGQYVGIIFGMLLGWLVFGTVPGLLSAIGIALILGSALYVVVIKESDKEDLDAKFEGEYAEVGLLGMEERSSQEMRTQESW